MTRAASLILSAAAICLTATAQAAAPCCGSIHTNRNSADVSRTLTADDGSIHTNRYSSDSSTTTTADDGSIHTNRLADDSVSTD